MPTGLHTILTTGAQLPTGADATVLQECKRMVRAGFRVDWEPYLKSVLLAIRAHLLGVRRPACPHALCSSVERGNTLYSGLATCCCT